MNSYRVARLELERMEAARRETIHQLRAIDQHICSEAERQTIAERPKARRYRRGMSRWTDADERHYLRRIDDISDRRRAEINALRRKIDRQTNAIEARRRKLGVNTPPEPPVVLFSD